MTQKADVVIVGGGVHGTSLAYYLLRGEAGRVVLLEKDGIAAGATGRSASFIRHHYSNAICVELVQESIKLLRDLGGDGEPPHVIPHPLLILAGEEHADPLQENVAMQRGLGVEVEILDPAEVAQRFPHIDLGGIDLAALEADAGYGDASALSDAYAREAVRLGGEMLTSTAVTALEVKGGRMAGVQTTTGTIEASKVVLAAGPWAAPLASTAGAPIPVKPALLSLGVLAPPEIVAETPMVFDMTTETYWRPYEDGTLLVGTDEETEGSWDPDALPAGVSFDFVTSAHRRVAKRWPGMAEARFVRGWVGVDGATPDLHPIIGPDTRVEGLYLDTGFSGHGFKFSPAVGRGLAEHILHGAYRSLDLTPFRFERFDEGDLFTTRYTVNVVQ